MSDFYILISKTANSCIVHMAQQLQYYVKKSTGKDIPIEDHIKNGSCFSLGLTDAISSEEYKKHAEKTKGDGFILMSDKGSIFVIAKTLRGILYGTYDYLERFFNIRFLTKDCEYVPEIKEIPVLKEEVVSNPSINMRTYLTADIFQGTVDKDFYVKTRTDDIFTLVPEEYGGREKVYGRNFVHNFHFYVPFEIYGNEHPEWYRFFNVNGEISHTIDLTNGITEDGKLDESMEISVAKVVIEELKKDIIFHPETDIFNFTQEDGGIYFDDENNKRQEKKYKRSGILIRFCNVVVRELNKYCQRELNGRKIKIITFAYAYAQDPPVEEINGNYVPLDKTVIADENLIIQLAIFSNAMYDYFSEKQGDQLKNALKGWIKVAKDFWFWAYDIDFRRYNAFFNSFDVVKQNVLGFKNFGISYLCINGPYESSTNWQANIRAYMYRKLMWDTSLDDKKLFDEFVEIYYGQASQTVKDIINEYTDYFNEIGKKNKDFTFTTRGDGSKPENMPLEMIKDSVERLKACEESIRNSDEKDKDEYIKRVERIRFSCEFFVYDNFRYYYPDVRDEDYIKLKDHIFKLGNDCGIDYIGERWTLAQQETEWKDGLKNKEFSIQ